MIKEPFGSYVFVTDWLQLFGNLGKQLQSKHLTNTKTCWIPQRHHLQIYKNMPYLSAH